MEIGISRDVLLDIGLNAAGFFIGGTIIMLIASLWKSRRITVGASSGMAVVERPTVQPAAKDLSQRSRKADIDGAFINFNNFDWYGDKAPSTPKRELSGASRNRQEVIKMARQMLADKRNESEVKANLPVTDGELAYARYLEKLTSTGRNR